MDGWMRWIDEIIWMHGLIDGLMEWMDRWIYRCMDEFSYIDEMDE
jgi:hypothetical protein